MGIVEKPRHMNELRKDVDGTAEPTGAIPQPETVTSAVPDTGPTDATPCKERNAAPSPTESKDNDLASSTLPVPDVLASTEYDARVKSQQPPAEPKAEEDAPEQAPVSLAPPTRFPLRQVGPNKPQIYVQLQLENQGGWDQRLYDTLKKLIDQADPLMGSAGKAFSYMLDLNIDKYFSVTSAQASPELQEKTGLSLRFVDQNIILEGTPSKGFDGAISFCFIRQSNYKEAQLHKKAMYIADDPRSLWQNLPVEDDEGYPAPDEAVDALVLGTISKTAVAASCRGRSHAHMGKPRDDYFLMDADAATGWYYMTVADGAGGSRYSRKGSELACRTVIAQLKEDLASQHETILSYEADLRLWKERFTADKGADKPERDAAFRNHMVFDAIMHRAVYAAYQAIAEEAAAREAQPREYHTTLLCAAFRKFSFGYLFLCYWVGDGGMALYNWNNEDVVLVPGVPDGGEFAGQTRFLTMAKEEINAEAVKHRTRYLFADAFEALIMMTDGITDPFFPSEKAVTSPETWRNFWNKTLHDGDADNPGCPLLFDDEVPPLERAKALRAWLDFWSKGNHDDRTMLVIR